MIVCNDYKTYLNSYPVYCSPVGYEIRFNVVLRSNHSWDTLNSQLFIPIDSFFAVLTDLLQAELPNEFFGAWEKVILNQYKVNYENVLQFAKEKNLDNYGINFSYGKKQKHVFKFYWFVNTDSVTYRISPESGIVKTLKLSPIKSLKETINF